MLQGWNSILAKFTRLKVLKWWLICIQNLRYVIFIRLEQHFSLHSIMQLIVNIPERMIAHFLALKLCINQGNVFLTLYRNKTEDRVSKWCPLMFGILNQGIWNDDL
jgi:hypothetical protein